MGLPRLLVKNFFSRRIYPLHVLTPSAASGAGEIAGNEFGRVGDGCRDPFDFWTNATANTEVRGQVDCAIARDADMLVIDRGHNLAGKQVLLERSPDASAWTTVLDVTIPSSSAPGTLDDSNGVVARDGAWLRHFSTATNRYWRVRIPAMGAGLRPQVVGIWLGPSWAPGYLDVPLAPDSHEIGGQEGATQAGWAIRSGLWVRRYGHVGLRLPLVADYDTALDHIQYQFGLNRPMWLVHDDARGDHAVLAVPPLGRLEIAQRRPGWFYPWVEFDWIEHEPLEVV